jgi:hypothetical protein
MIRQHTVEDLRKYSFLDDVTITDGKVFMYYWKDGERKFKKLPLRVSIEKLQKTVKEIEKELGVSIYGHGRNQDYFIV